MVKLFRLYAALALIASSALFAQGAQGTAPADFYQTMLRRGIASFDAGRDADAVRQLRIAAFGFVDALDSYQTAQTYLALAYERTKDGDRAGDSARKVIAAQRKSPRYAALALPDAVRTAFEALATRLLSASEVAVLRSNAPQAAVVAPPTATVPRQNPPVQTNVARPPQPTPAKPVATTPAPETTKPASPAPQRAATEARSPATTTPPPTAATAATPEKPKTVTTEVPFQPAPPQQPKVASQPPAATEQRPPAPAAKPATPAARPVPSDSDVAQRLTAAERALSGARLAEARATYRELLSAGTLSRGNLLRVAEGLYRARDFGPALEAFTRLGTLGRGEEPYRYYVAVALYETGAYARAKEELRAALPFIEVTPDVARYQAKIDGAAR